MDPVIKTKWQVALRSGKYQQTKKRLRGDTGHCCLGVLCELAVQEGVIAPAVKYGFYYFDNQFSLLPKSVMVWSGIDTDAANYGVLTPDDHALAHDNDSGKTFEEIADIIEERF